MFGDPVINEKIGTKKIIRVIIIEERRYTF